MLENLKELSIIGVKKWLGPACSFGYSGFPRLEKLDLRGTYLSEGDMYALMGSTSPLKELSVTTSGFQPWLHRTKKTLLQNNLEKLTLYQCNLRSDDYLYSVAKSFKKLSYVKIQECYGSDLSSEGLKMFEIMLKENNSSCEVIYDESTIRFKSRFGS